MTIATLATVAIAPVDSVLKAAQKSVTSPATEQLTSKFEAMMQAPRAEQVWSAQAANAPQAPQAPAGPNAITQLVDKQQSLLQKSFADAEAFAANASNLSMQEVAAQSMKLSHDMTMANFNLQSITAVAQGSNKSLQTLLKNQ
jgi:type III secretion system HrpB2-like protein